MHNKLTEHEASELTLDSYLMHIHRRKCACGAHERFHTLYEVWTHPTKTRTTGYRDLRPALRALRDLPVAYVNLPFETTPICSVCVKDYKSPTQRATESASPQLWAETLKKKYTPAAAEVKVARSAAGLDRTIPAPTPDQL